MTPKSAKNSLSIRLSESVVFLRGSVESTVMGRRTTRESQPAMLRGLLTLNLDKPTKVSSIDIALEGKSQTAWPEGVGARKLDVTEEHEIFSAKTVYFHAGKTQSSSARRTASVGPGLILDHEDAEDDAASTEETRQQSQQADSAAAASPFWLSSSRRRVSMDHQYLHLSRASRNSFDDIPTPPYSPPGTRPGSFLRNDSNQSIPPLTPGPPPSIGPRSDSWRPAGSDSVHSSRILEDPTVSDQHGSNADIHSLEDFLGLPRETSEPQSSSSSSHSPSTADLSLSRRESVDEHEAEDLAAAYERSRSRGRPRASAAAPATGSAGQSRPPSLLRTPSTAPTSPSTSASHAQSSSGTMGTNLFSASSQPAQANARTASTSSNPERDRGRRHARFSLAMVSNALLDAVKERVRSNSRGAIPRAGKERAATPAPVSRDHSLERGGAGSSARRSRVRSRMRDPSLDNEGERGRVRTRSHSRGLDEDGLKHKEKERTTLGRIGGVLGLDVDGGNGEGDNWKEFRKGIYTYPISFAIPADSPPSLQCDYGSVTYRLKATVHRPGAFTHRLTATCEVVLIASPGEDDLEESDNIVVQREWDAQMHYAIVVSGRSFPIGSAIPLHITFMPLAKVKIFRITALIEEKVEYFTQYKRLTRADVARRFELLALRYTEKDAPPLLPLATDYEQSPLRGLVDAPDASEAASALMGPGPWAIEARLQLPRSCSRMHFTNKHRRSNVKITHTLKIVFRVERGDDTFLDSRTGLRKHFDIVVQTPIHILSCRCSPEWTALPRYSCLALDAHARTQTCPCTQRLGTTTDADEADPTMLPPDTLAHTPPPPQGATVSAPATPAPAPPHYFHALFHPFEPHADIDGGTGGRGGPVTIGGSPYPNHAIAVSNSTSTGANTGTYTGSPLTRAPSEADSDTGSLLRRNTQFARLVAGEESERGEAPPRYERVAPALAPVENARGARAFSAVVDAPAYR
ncbi:hypothetical protein M0805_006756 [Coniferiporia weirii]|nr:hypothetical protein M0805_006756 [Coniferiporia weirii]